MPADCDAPTAGDIYGWEEFPILRGKVPFDEGSNPGPDRVSVCISMLLLRLTVLQVIFARKNDGNFVYCYIVYHKNNGDFDQCR